MHRNLRNLLIALAATSLMACGGDDTEEQVDNDQIECGEGTRQFGEECVPDLECGAGEFELPDGRCIRSDYCAEGTVFNQDSGRCRADDELGCGPNTEDQDGECVPSLIIGCGDGTVAAGAICVPTDDVCGDGTESAQNQCRPTADICGEGTVYDVNERRCIRTSILRCGPGTTALDGLCIPSINFYQDLANNPNLDLNDPLADPSIALKDVGERFIIVGNIDSPTVDGDDLIQDEDVITFEADPGQWVRIGVYSLGLPEPGFLLEADQFTRLSDLGAGIETVRDIVLPGDEEISLTISNLPQMLGNVGPAGGDDWNYVAYIETMDAPDAIDFDLDNDTFSGSVLDTRDNLYQISGVDAGRALAVLFSTTPLTAEGEAQVWNDAGELLSVSPLDDVTTFDSGGDPFYLLFDRVHAYGGQTNFTSTGFEIGDSLSSGDVWQETISLEAGDYVGLFQFNLDSASLQASVLDESDAPLRAAQNLDSSDTPDGEFSYYYYSPVQQEVTLQLENTADDLGFFSPSYFIGQSESIDNIDGTLVDFSSDIELSAGESHFVVLDVTVDQLIAVESSTADLRLRLRNDAGDQLLATTEFFAHPFTPGTYLLEVQAIDDVDGFALTLEETDIFEVELSSSPDLAIPKDGLFDSDTITVSSCPSILSIELSVDITHWWRGDLMVYLDAPNGDRIQIHDQTGGSASDLVATYPNPSGTGFEAATGLLDLEGENGTGDWSLDVGDVWTPSSSVGTLNTWSITLTCQG